MQIQSQLMILEDISRMYNLLSVIQALDPLKEILEKHVQNIGFRQIHEVSRDAINDPQLYVDTILKVHRKFNTLIKLVVDL